MRLLTGLLLLNRFFCSLYFCCLGFCADFSHSYESYTCPKALAESIERAVTKSLALGRRPILACDIDETLVKRKMHNGIEYFVPTQFSMLLRSDILEKVFAVMALTARSVKEVGLLEETNMILKGCSPDFHKYMTRGENFGGSFSQRPNYLDSSVGFVYQNGLLMMGEVGTTKRDALDSYFKINPLEEAEYDFIFIDNDSGWFPRFRTGGYAVNIHFGYLFHLDFERCEQTIFNPLPAFPVIAKPDDSDDDWEIIKDDTACTLSLDEWQVIEKPTQQIPAPLYLKHSRFRFWR